MSISEISTQLDKAVSDIQAKRSAKDTAEKAYQAAAAEYDGSLTKVSELRTQLDAELDKLIPTARVR
jgi:IS30 family transposase